MEPWNSLVSESSQSVNLDSVRDTVLKDKPGVAEEVGQQLRVCRGPEFGYQYPYWDAHNGL